MIKRNSKLRMTAGVDLISNLPDGIIDNILRYLPIQDIARTSVLSKQWRYKWVYCSDIELQKPLRKCAVYQILERLQGPLLRVFICLSNKDGGVHINKLIDLLPNNDLQNLTLCVYPRRLDSLTHHLFTFQNLRNLRLSYCAFDIPLECKGFSKLVSLELEQCSLVCETFGKFVSLCPAIERMRLLWCTYFDCFEINCPKLKSFDFHGELNSMSFKNCCILSHVVLYANVRNRQFAFSLVESLRSLPSLECLELKASALKDLVVYMPLNVPSNALKMLKNLHISINDFTVDASSIVCFIQCCPNLQRLVITMCGCTYKSFAAYSFHSQNYLKKLDSLTCLRTVNIKFFSVSEFAMELAKYLLASATGLEEMVFMFRDGFGDWRDKAKKILKELEQFPCASSGVEIKIMDSECKRLW